MCCAITIPRAAAQDVTAQPLDWQDPAGRGDQPPLEAGFSLPKFPPELAKTTQIGWAEVETYVGDKGEIYQREAHGTLPYYEDAASAACSKVSYRPAMHEGQPAAAGVCRVLLFNPASAKSDSPDATPRLLRAGIIVDPTRQTAAEIVRPRPEVVWVSARIDADGQVEDLVAPSKRLTKLIAAGVARWRFAPAREHGKPVEATLRIPVILAAPGGPGRDGMVPVRVLSHAPVMFPYDENRAGVTGVVVLEFVVNREGGPEDIRVLRSTTDGFARAAIESMERWKFAPALLRGQPVASQVRQEIAFRLDGQEDGFDSGAGVKVTRKGDPSKLPEGLRYDTAPKLRRLSQPEYPHDLLVKSANGSAQILAVIGPDGKVLLSKVIRASRPEFGYALQAAVEQFEYEPAIKDGNPTPTMLTVAEDFEPTDPLILSDEDLKAVKLERKHAAEIAKPADLDSPIKPVYTPPPAYPRSLQNAVPGEATVEFLIDSHGRSRLPRIVSASQPEFGYAAVEGVSHWVFDPPLSKGKPVAVLVRVPIHFQPPAGYPNDQRISFP